MARATSTPELSSRRPRFQWSVWTFVAPVALALCVLVIYAIAHGAGWLEHGKPAPAKVAPHPRPANVSSTATAMLYRPRKGDTLTDIAVRFGVSLSGLRALNPKLPVDRALPTGHRIRLR